MGQGQGFLAALGTLLRFAKMMFEPVFRGVGSALWHAIKTVRHPRGSAIFLGTDDMSIGDYYAQRHGTPDLVDRMLSAMMHGTAGGDVWKLSMASSPLADTLFDAKLMRLEPMDAMPRAVDDEMMREHLKDPATFKLAAEHLTSSSVWFRNGFSTLANALGSALAKMPNVTIRLNDPATRIEYIPGIDQVQLTTKENPHPLAYDKVISTILAKDLVALTGTALPALASETAVTIMVVNLWYPTPHLNAPNHGFGYLIPQATPFAQNPEFVLGAIFDSDRESLSLIHI